MTQKTPRIDTPKAAGKSTTQGTSTTDPSMLLSGSVGALCCLPPGRGAPTLFLGRLESDARPAASDEGP